MSEPVFRELEQRWQQMLHRVAEGDDIPPSLRLRAEGLMEALVLAGEATPEALQAAMDAAHTRELGDSLSARLGEQWRGAHPFPQIPFFQRRAPVQPSTAD